MGDPISTVQIHFGWFRAVLANAPGHRKETSWNVMQLSMEGIVLTTAQSDAKLVCCNSNKISCYFKKI